MRLVLLLGITVFSWSQNVEISDPFLKSCLLSSYDQDSDGEISMSEAALVTDIRCAARGIETLDGIEAFINLKVLDVDQNDLTALPSLTTLGQIETLEFGENRVAQLGDLSGLQNLKDMYCGSNGMTSMGALPASLRELRCGGNLMTELPPLPIGLEILSCGWNQLDEVPDLSQLVSLRSLSMGHNPFSQLPSLSHLSALEFLTIGGLQLTEIPSLAGFDQLTGLDFSDNPLTSLPDLASLQLTYLGIAELGLTDLSILNGQVELQTLYAQRNELTDASALALLPDLSFVNVSSNQLQTFPDMTGKDKLSGLFLQDNQLTDIPNGVSGLDRLNLFFIQENMLDLSDCADIYELSQKEGLSFIYSPQLVGELDCQSIGELQSVVPWVVQNSQWNSRVSLFNAGTETVAVQIKAVPRSGETQEKIIEIGANSVFAASSEQLFGSLTGYALYVYAEEATVYPSFLTFNLDAASKNSPAQTVGLPPSQWGEHLLFGYLPEDMVPALVFLAPQTQAAETTVTCTLFDEMGATGLSVEVDLRENRPLALLVTDLFDLETLPSGSAVKIRSQDGTQLAGTTFVFNTFLEPVMTIPFKLSPEN